MNTRALPCILLLAAPALFAQPPQASSTPTLQVKTQLTIEDVTVTDDKGRPVHGLTESDFIVKEDGKPQAIQSFQEYRVQPPQQTPVPKLPPNIYTNQQVTAPSAYNILLFDNVATGLAGQLARAPENLMFSQQQAIQYLKNMPEGTQIAILQLATGLHIVQGFTSDRAQLLAAVQALKPEPVQGTFMVGGSDTRTPTELCEVANTQSQMTTEALNEVAAFASGIKGRKNLIWFTPGMPWLTSYGLYSVAISTAPWLTTTTPNPRESGRIACVADETTQLRRAYSLLAAARVVVDTVDPRGLDEFPKGLDGTMDVRVSASVRMADKASIQDVAEATGGKAYLNRNDLDAEIGEAIAAGSDYYSLSYVPPLSKSDGKRHSIKVAVNRPGVHLLYREGYVASDFAPPKEDKKNPPNPPGPDTEFLAAMAHGLPNATGLLFGVSVLPAAPAKPGEASDADASQFLNPKLKGKPLVRYDIAYALPAGAITLAGDPSGPRTGSFKIAVLAYDNDGEPLNSVIRSSSYNIKPDQAAQFLKQPSRLDVQVDLPPGKVFLRIGVLDLPSQKMGILEIPQTVAAAK